MPLHDKCCYGPYTVECTGCSSGDGALWYDSGKTRRLCRSVPCEGSCETVYGASYEIITNDTSACPSCQQCLLESQSLGRQYRLVITACSVIITEFEHESDCGECLGNSSEFCFGRTYSADGTSIASDNGCTTTFEYDGHTFTVHGVESECIETYECGDCVTDDVSHTEQGVELVSGTPSECTPDDYVSPADTEVTEPQIVWHNAPTTSAGRSLNCSDEQTIRAASGTDVECQSQQRPSVDVLQAGTAIVAYEERATAGLVKASLSQKSTTVGNKVVHGRALGTGHLLNNSSNLLGGLASFRIYDDYVPNTSTHKIGFLTGPLAGHLYSLSASVTNLGEDVPASQRYVEVRFYLGDSPATSAVLGQDGYHDVAYFIVDSTDTGLVVPYDFPSTNIYDLPYHGFVWGSRNLIGTVANPCVVSTTDNTHMVRQEQYVYVVYQAYEIDRWKIYLRQVRISPQATSAVAYASPHSLMSPVYVSDEPLTYKPVAMYTLNINGDDITRVVYDIETESRYPILQRESLGDVPDYIHRAKALVTYAGNLSVHWTEHDRSAFEFSSYLPHEDLNLAGPFPFDLYDGSVFGAKSAIAFGDTDMWAYYADTDMPRYSYPSGHGSAGSAVDDPILIASSTSGSCIRPKVCINHDNQIIVAYEDTSSGLPEIKLKATGDLYQDSATGPSGGGVTRFLTVDDFVFSHRITLGGLNQLADIAVDRNNTVHVCWQSNVSGRWEIYYANGSDGFAPHLVTDFASRSTMPSISVNNHGHVVITYVDDRFGAREIMAAYLRSERCIPLLQQDAYLCGLRNGYTHYSERLRNLPPVSYGHLRLSFYTNRDFVGDPDVVVSGDESPRYFYEDTDGSTFDPRGDDLGFSKNTAYFVKVEVVTSYGSEIKTVTSTFSYGKYLASTSAIWVSSAHDRSDTRVTSASGDSTSPVTCPRPNGSTMIFWQDERTGSSSILGGIIDTTQTQEKVYASGSLSWFDHGGIIAGRRPAVVSDLYGRAVLAYEKPESSPGTGSAGELPESAIGFRNCEFQLPSETASSSQWCDYTSILGTSAAEVSEPSVMARLKKSDVDYFTVNAAGKPVPVVSKCSVTFELLGSPETIAYRASNEGGGFSDWTSFESAIGGALAEIEWTLSPEPGTKEVCFQFATYGGVTETVIVQAVADYAKPPFQVRLYSDAEYQVQLPTYQNLYVASTGGQDTATMYVEIEAEGLSTPPTFDVLQQGSDDHVGIQTTAFSPTLYRGSFQVRRQYGSRNKDGYARILPRLGTSCYDPGATTNAGGEFDPFNLPVTPPSPASNDPDPLLKMRDRRTGLIGMLPDSRYLPEDPYFAFGDPDYAV